MFQTPTPPPKDRDERKNKPRRVTDSSRTERVKLTQFYPTKEKPGPPSNPQKGHQNKPRSNLASIFGTLLSSQESHAHQHTTTKQHIGATVQIYPPSGLSHNRRRSSTGTSCGALASPTVTGRKPVPECSCERQVILENRDLFGGSTPCHRGGSHPPVKGVDPARVKRAGTHPWDRPPARRLRACCSCVRFSLSG